MIITRIEFRLLNSEIFHHDFVLQIPELEFYSEYDSYYFWPMNSSTGNERKEVIDGINKYFIECKSRLKSIAVLSRYFIPIDFSDQYYGGFMVLSQVDNFFNIDYGIIEDINTVVFDSEDEKLSHNLTEREFKSYFSFLILKDDFISSFELNVQ